MSIEITELANGVTVLSQLMPHVETVALGVWLQAGSRDEADNENGLAHLLEHMAFKGTTRRSAFDIAAEIESAGGDINAATSMETTAYHVRVLRQDWRLAFDVISDIVLDPIFAAEDLDMEKYVIGQEIAAAQDTPDDLVFELAQSAAWPDHPLGRDILGTPESVSSFVPQDLMRYRSRHYSGDRTVVAAAGQIDHQQLVTAAAEKFGRLEPSGEARRSAPAYAGGSATAVRPLDQVHQVLAFEAPGYLNDDIYAVKLLASILGGGMSSRLFQEARERRGLCYSTFAFASAFADTGLLQIYAATAPDKAAEFCKVASDVVSDLAGSAGDDELQRARAQVKAALVASLESPAARADQMARQYISFGKVPTMQEILGKVDAVTAADIKRLTGEIFAGGSVSHAVIGPSEQLAHDARLAARFD
jgi:predicted Zn-dependent peptidase